MPNVEKILQKMKRQPHGIHNGHFKSDWQIKSVDRI